VVENSRSRSKSQRSARYPSYEAASSGKAPLRKLREQPSREPAYMKSTINSAKKHSESFERRAMNSSVSKGREVTINEDED
jgi:hypothetical protein